MQTRLATAILSLVFAVISHAEQISIVIKQGSPPRIAYGASRLQAALKAASIDSTIADTQPKDSRSILVGNFDAFPVPGAFGGGKPAPEGYLIQSDPAHTIRIWGGDDSGALYGCLELAQRIHDAGK